MKLSRVFVLPFAVVLLASCSGGEPGGESSPVPVESTEDGGAVIGDGEEAEAEAEGDAGFESTGSALGDENREEYAMLGVPAEDLEGVSWAGDVSTEEGSFVEYPDGLRIEFVGVEPGSAPVSEEQGDLDPEKDLVRVNLLVSNNGPDALPIDGSYTPFRVFEGENLTEVSSHVGYFGEEDDLYSADDASVIAPGSSLEVFQSFEVEPGTSLEVELNPDFFGVEHTPFVFYGVTAP